MLSRALPENSLATWTNAFAWHRDDAPEGLTRFASKLTDLFCGLLQSAPRPTPIYEKSPAIRAGERYADRVTPK